MKILDAKKFFGVFSYFANLHKLATNIYKIQTWDAGWYQIKHCLTEQNLGLELVNGLKSANNKLAEKILPNIEKYGFLDIDEVYEAL